jgi:hypothetical protein
MLRGETDGSVSYWNDVIEKLQRPNVARHLTESAEDDVGSVAKVLATMICLADRLAHVLQNKAQVSVLFLALLGETASRGARIQVKQNSGDSLELLMSALGITLDSCVFPRPVHEKVLVIISLILSVINILSKGTERYRVCRYFRRDSWPQEIRSFLYTRDCVVQLPSNSRAGCAGVDGTDCEQREAVFRLSARE